MGSRALIQAKRQLYPHHRVSSFSLSSIRNTNCSIYKKKEYFINSTNFRRETVASNASKLLFYKKFGNFQPFGVRGISHSFDLNEKPMQNRTRKNFHGGNLQIDPTKYRSKWVFKLRKSKNKFLSSVRHYWCGTKLLCADTKISFKLLKKFAKRKKLSRREKGLLFRTGSDILKLVPFSFFALVPFMELLLPFFLKVFPNMLPSTLKGEAEKTNQKGKF